jgi:hypothetical protein
VSPHLHGRGHSMAPGITAFILLPLIAGWMLATDFLKLAFVIPLGIRSWMRSSRCSVSCCSVR